MPRRPRPTPRPTPSLRELEERFAGRALAWAGGLALVAAAIFFLSLAFSRGWINEPMRVLIGLAAGGAALAAGWAFLDRRNPLMGRALSAVGLGTISVSLIAATRLYGLVPPEVGLAAALVTACVAAAMAIRFDAREIAAFGLVAALIAPPAMGATADPLTLAFIAATLVGTTTIALFRSWRWLPVIAFVLTAPQIASWLVSGPDAVEGLVVLAGFWLVTAVAAAGEEIRVPGRRPAADVGDARRRECLVPAVGRLRGADGRPRAVARHLRRRRRGGAPGLGGWFLRRQGLEHLFGNLVAATGVAFVTLAAFVQLGAALIPVAWSAEAVALTWLAVRRRHRWSVAGALGLAGLVALHLGLVEFPLPLGWPFVGAPLEDASAPGALASLGAVLVALALAAAIVPHRFIRSTLAGVGDPARRLGAPVRAERDGPGRRWVLLVPIGLIVDVIVRETVDDPALSRLIHADPPLQPATLAGFVGWSAAALYAFVGDLSPSGWASAAPPAIPFTDERTLVAAILVAGALVAAWWVPVAAFRCLAIMAALLVAALLVPFEVDAAGVVVLWIVLAAVATLASRLEPPDVPVFTVAAATLTGCAMIAAWAFVAPPTHLMVVVRSGAAPRRAGGSHSPRSRPDWRQLRSIDRSRRGRPGSARRRCDPRLRGLGRHRGDLPGDGRWRHADRGARQAGAGRAQRVLDRRSASGALVAGMDGRRATVGEAGLALIALATAKVFVIDLASMDVAYRALVLTGLGVLLLLGAWLFSRFRGPRDGSSEGPEALLPGS